MRWWRHHYVKRGILFLMNEEKIFIIKSDGSREAFDVGKLKKSLSKAKASVDVTEKIAGHIAREIEDGMSTSAIYRHAFELLHKFERPAAARYSLKRAIADLGPSGFPFEKFIAELFRARGFETLTDQIVDGKCSSHEMDVIMWNENKLLMAEAKFHNEIGIKSDLKVALYIKARFDDLKGQKFMFGRQRMLDEGFLITNTNFTTRAISYSECAGVRLIGWNYPKVGNLHNLIEDEQLHPITCLTSLSPTEKRGLLEKGIVLCKSVRGDAEMLRAAGLDTKSIERAVDESAFLCPVN